MSNDPLPPVRPLGVLVPRGWGGIALHYTLTGATEAIIGLTDPPQTEVTQFGRVYRYVGTLGNGTRVYEGE